MVWTYKGGRYLVGRTGVIWNTDKVVGTYGEGTGVVMQERYYLGTLDGLVRQGGTCSHNEWRLAHPKE